MFTLDTFLAADRTPMLYETGSEFWNDPYISGQLLQAHLAADTDQASYRPETINAICQSLPAAMGLPAGAAIADLGCGPGLYCAALERQGFRMTGIDRSQSSLAYAKAHAPQAQFLQASYLQPFGQAQFDAAIMVSQDYGVLCPANRQTLLANLHTALKPSGFFAFDVSSLHAFAERTAASVPTWYTANGGLFRPHRHAVLQKTVFFPDHSALCDLYTVLDTQATTYRFWQTFFSPQSIRAELESAGFRVTAVCSDLADTPFRDTSPALGIICQKA